MISIVTFLPLATVLALLLVPRTNDRAIRLVSLFGSLATLGFALALLLAFSHDPGSKGFQLIEQRSWIPRLGISYKVGVDGISLFLVVLTAVLTPISILASWSAIEKRVLEFHASLLILETGILGVFVALDLVLFYVFWEVMLIPM
ncbi:MAG: Fe-S-binding domain-containing protein, partial [Planctomycetes bacterium]|nr:Fe-S-binding domain-containing protein [Planctomycetota bacterium]